VSVEQAPEIIDHGFFDIVQMKADLTAVSPAEPLQASFHLDQIA
jgi:hypothetical protein